MDHKNSNRGLKPTGRVMMLIMLTLFLILFAITGVSFAMIAHTGIVHDQDLLAMALEYQLGTRIVQSRRGTFLDRDGGVIATQHPSHTMYANFYPSWGSVVEDVDYTAQRLAEVIEMDLDEITWILSQENTRQARFGDAGQRLSFTQKSIIEELELPGIYFVDDLTRFYPKGEFASHTIGYTIFGEDIIGRPSQLEGAMGLERFYDDILTGTNGKFQFPQDQFGFRQPGEERRYITYPLDGHDITLTIDSTIQVFLETAMDDITEQADPDSIVAVVMNARTGEILAAGSRPTFNPNTRNPESYQNAIIYPFEPGSTLKVITYAAAINEGDYRGDQTFLSGGRTLSGNTSVQDHPLIPRMEMTFDEGFFRSTNTSVIDLLRGPLTHAQFVDYLAVFGFGEITGFPSHDEHAGSLPDIDISVVHGYTAGFGQGIDITPLQLIQATTAFLNGGEMIRPQLIAEIYDPNTNTITQQFEREVVGTPITAETAQQMRELMIGVVENPVGTGHVNYRLNVPSGGKTGTAQIPGPEGGYLEGAHIYSYIGFAPAEDPEIIMFVAIENPTTDRTSGHPYAGQIYRFVMDNTLSYLGLTQPQTTEEGVPLPEIERVEAPRLLNLSTADAIASVEALGLIPVVIGNRDVVFEQSPTSGTMVVVGERVFIKTDIEDNLPNFTGWTRAQIHQYGRLLGLDIAINGHGLGARQTIRAGRLVRQGDSLSVTLE